MKKPAGEFRPHPTGIGGQMSISTPTPETKRLSDEDLRIRWEAMTPLQRAFFLPALALAEAATRFTDNTKDVLEMFIREIGGGKNLGELHDWFDNAMTRAAVAQLSCTAAAWDRESFAEFVRITREGKGTRESGDLQRHAKATAAINPGTRF